jgi:hypothetical protein
MLALQANRRFEIRDDHDAAEQTPNECRERFRSRHLSVAHRDGAGRQVDQVIVASGGWSAPATQARLPRLFAGDVAQNVGREAGFCRTTACMFRPNAASSAATYSRSTSRLATSAPPSAGADALRIIETFEHGLRAFRQAFAFFVQLPQDLEPGFLLGHAALDPECFLLGVAECLLLRAQLLVRGAQRLEECFDGLLLVIRRAFCALDRRLRFIARGSGGADLLMQLGDSHASGVASRLCAGNFIGQRADAVLGARECHLETLQFCFAIAALRS